MDDMDPDVGPIHEVDVAGNSTENGKASLVLQMSRGVLLKGRKIQTASGPVNPVSQPSQNASL